MMPGLLVVGLLFTPLAWAVLSLLLHPRYGRWVSRVGIVLQVAVSVALWLVIAEEGALHYALGGWEAPLGIGLRVDGLAVTFVLLTTVVASACGLYASVHLDLDAANQRSFWTLFWFLWAGLDGVWLAADLFNIYVGLELLTLSAVGLVALGGKPPALRAALRYLFAALLGSLTYLLGVAILYGSYGSLSLADVAASINDGRAEAMALALMVVGLAVKTALVPLHGWLPPAHGIAKTPVSAMLSALVVKASFYVMARLWLDLGDRIGGAAMAQFIGALGALAIVWGAWMALRQAHLKMLVAYSSVSQLGYLFLLFPLTFQVPEAVGARAQQGVALHLISHGLAKAAMFLAAGNLIVTARTGRVDGLAGVSRYLPFSLFSFGLAAVSIMGLPPSGGFAAKWLLLQCSLGLGQWWWTLTIVAGGLMSAAYVFKVLGASYDEGQGGKVFVYLPRRQEAIPFVLALMALGLGLVANEPLEIMGLSSVGAEAS